MVTKKQAQERLKEGEGHTDNLLQRIKDSDWSIVIMAGQAVFWLILGGWISARYVCGS